MSSNDTQRRLDAAETQALDGPASFPSNQLLNQMILVASLFAFGTVMLLVLLAIFLLPGAQDVSLAQQAFLKGNCQICQTQIGGTGGTGGTGGPGRDGRNGTDGKDGRNGTDAVCVPNPLFPCAKGDKGDTGGTGGTGPQGVCPPCPTGGTGPSGPSGPMPSCPVCPCTVCPSGGTGPSGPPGNITGDVVLNNVNVTGDVIFYQQPQCMTPLGPDCLGPGGCFNFSMCDLQARSLLLKYPSGISLLQVGDDTSAGKLQVGKAGAFSHQAIFGYRLGAGNYKMASFQTYATSVILESSTFLTLFSQQDVNFGANGNYAFTVGGTASHTVGGVYTLNVNNDITIDMTNAVKIFRLNSAGSLIISAGNTLIHESGYIVGTRSASIPGQRWFDTNPDTSVQCAGLPTGLDATRQSMTMYQDLVMAAENPNNTYAPGGARIVSAKANGYLTLGPFLELCGGILRSVGNTLQLQDNADTDILDFRGKIRNGQLIGETKVVVEDTDGLDIRNTPIMNTGLDNEGRVYFNDPDGYHFAGPNTTTIFEGDVIVMGNLTGFTTITSPDCCASDKRVKTDIKTANTHKAYSRLMKVPLKEFRYHPDYLANDPRLKNTTYIGVIAQEVEDEFDYMVSKAKAVVGRIVHQDLRFLRPELLYGEFIGAIQHMDSLHKTLKSRVEQAEQKLSSIANRVSQKLDNAGTTVSHALHSRIERLEKMLQSVVSRSQREKKKKLMKNRMKWRS